MQIRRPVWDAALAVLLVAACAGSAFCQNAPRQNAGSADHASASDDVTQLKQQLAAQQKLLEQMQATMQQMKARLDRAEQASKDLKSSPMTASSAPAESVAAPSSAAPSTARQPASLGPASFGEVASLTPVIPKSSADSQPAMPLMSSADPHIPAFFNNGASQADEQGMSPLSVKIGGAEFTPGGFMDFTVFGRSTNLGSGIGSSFGSAPYSNTSAGQLSETRFTMQNSRLSMDVNARYVGFDWHGHVEADFLGFSVPNLYTTSNSNTMRSRLYWIDGRKGKFEFLGGQSWSMMTPNRQGLSPNPSDIFYSQDMDTNYQLGLTWSRQAQLRLIYHPTDTIAAGISIEDGDQYYGGATVPGSLAAQGDNGSGSITNSNAGNNPAAPSVAPDVVAKVAFDPMIGKLHEHVEFAGVMTQTRIFDPTAKVRNAATGGGFSANFNLEVVKNLHLILNTFYSDGAGRYIFGLAPNFVVDYNAAGIYRPSLVHADSGIAGFEYQINKQTMLYGYYGAMYVGRDYGVNCYAQAIPPDSPPGTTAACNFSMVTSSPQYVGYGYPGSSSSQNRSIQEPTFGVIQTFWKNPHYGALQLITQYSYLTRNPWVVSGPKDAHLSMAYVDLRYVLP
ncbi:MAG TPA: hypothetical protein VGZ29_09160 [Terriglobia bacterium]|nr:hypothetical protein [Terriglobia bacterium]